MSNFSKKTLKELVTFNLTRYFSQVEEWRVFPLTVNGITVGQMTPLQAVFDRAWTHDTRAARSTEKMLSKCFAQNRVWAREASAAWLKERQA